MERIFSVLTERDISLPIFVTGVGYEHYQDHVTRKEGFPNYHLAFCEQGVGKLIICNREYLIEQKTAFFFYPNVPHEYYPVAEPWSLRWIIFSGSSVHTLLNAAGIGRFEVYMLNSPEEVTFCCNKLHKILLEKKSTSMLEASGVLYNFLANINKLIEEVNSEGDTQLIKKLNSIIGFIKNNFKKDITLEELATHAGISSSYLCRIFKKEYGISPFTYILRCRVNAAKEELINFPDKSIKAISLDTGFNSCSYFGSVFKEYEGYSPNRFRELYFMPQ
ncbi:AraC family transcriptional regulator [Ruminiclostridium cellulolyticum]|uniref:Transcriptional regulator, AraC family n=1 Tax=Ruminiclostridium cellulolyticum (strain ATCC 35319 / DSM 5812 / JCM 6584 / H10) TaxID=394503 RepID=B8I993_RUMCH|nr:AraC family transcriptional regulator [Ruminiclostridium cellulolyticum]ACL75353.1 transcriptional regulator, AraC family [Ruminiclostridium cellulolyticum H10]